MKKLPTTDKDIEKECKQCGISMQQSINDTGLDHVEMQRRILAVWANNRNESLWKVAFISAVASVCSAIVAIIAVSCK